MVLWIQFILKITWADFLGCKFIKKSFRVNVFLFTFEKQIDGLSRRQSDGTRREGTSRRKLICMKYAAVTSALRKASGRLLWRICWTFDVLHSILSLRLKIAFISSAMRSVGAAPAQARSLTTVQTLTFLRILFRNEFYLTSHRFLSCYQWTCNQSWFLNHVSVLHAILNRL